MKGSISSFLVLAVGQSLLGCQPVSSAPIEREVELIQNISPEKENCPEILGVDRLLADKGRDIILVGEVHGVKAPPEFMQALVCHSLARGVKTTLALELSDPKNRLADYLKSDGALKAKTYLFEDQFWTTGFTSGLSSVAMLDLIDYARLKLTSDALFQVDILQLVILNLST